MRLTDDERAICEATVKKEKGKSQKLRVNFAESRRAYEIAVAEAQREEDDELRTQLLEDAAEARDDVREDLRAAHRQAVRELEAQRVDAIQSISLELATTVTQSQTARIAADRTALNAFAAEKSELAAARVAYEANLEIGLLGLAVDGNIAMVSALAAAAPSPFAAYELSVAWAERNEAVASLDAMYAALATEISAEEGFDVAETAAKLAHAQTQTQLQTTETLGRLQAVAARNTALVNLLTAQTYAGSLDADLFFPMTGSAPLAQPGQAAAHLSDSLDGTPSSPLGWHGWYGYGSGYEGYGWDYGYGLGYAHAWYGPWNDGATSVSTDWFGAWNYGYGYDGYGYDFAYGWNGYGYGGWWGYDGIAEVSPYGEFASPELDRLTSPVPASTTLAVPYDLPADWSDNPASQSPILDQAVDSSAETVASAEGVPATLGAVKQNLIEKVAGAAILHQMGSPALMQGQALNSIKESWWWVTKQLVQVHYNGVDVVGIAEAALGRSGADAAVQFLNGFRVGFFSDGLAGNLASVGDMVVLAAKTAWFGAQEAALLYWDPAGTLARYEAERAKLGVQVALSAIEAQHAYEQLRPQIEKLGRDIQRLMQDPFIQQAILKLDFARLILLLGEYENMHDSTRTVMLAVGEISQALFDAAGSITIEDSAYVVGRVVGFVAYNVAEGAALAGVGKLLLESKRVASFMLSATRVLEKFTEFVVPLPAAQMAELRMVVMWSLLKCDDALRGTCFAAGTRLLTPTGYHTIETFRPGDLIVARNESDPTAPTVIKAVEECFVLEARTLELVVGGKSVRTTAEHPFWVVGKGWTAARKLEPGDILVGSDNRRKPRPAGKTCLTTGGPNRQSERDEGTGRILARPVVSL